MKNLSAIIILILSAASSLAAQTIAAKIYETEKAFEKTAAEKGINQAFVEFTTSDGVCFAPGYAVNCREFFKALPDSRAAIIRNPALIDFSSNGALAYSTGNSVYKTGDGGSGGTSYGEYLTVWSRQPNGSYKAVLDTGIKREKSDMTTTNWITPAGSGKELNEKRSSAADASAGFYEIAAKQGRARAYKEFLAEDARLMYGGKDAITTKKAALDYYKKDKSTIRYARHSVFSSAADLAYISNTYTLNDKNGNELERGNFVQIWKLRNGKWQIVLDYMNQSALDSLLKKNSFML